MAERIKGTLHKLSHNCFAVELESKALTFPYQNAEDGDTFSFKLPKNFSSLRDGTERSITVEVTQFGRKPDLKEAPKKTRKQKVRVYGGRAFFEGKVCRAIVATTSMKKAAEAAGTTSYEVRHYWCETGNTAEVEIAMSEPGTCFYVIDGQSEFKKRKVN